MFFVASKVFFVLVRPLNLLILLLVAGLLLERTRLRRVGRGLVVAVALLMVLVGFSPIANIGLNALEDRFPRPGRLDPAPDGIVVLGGALDMKVNGARPGLVSLNDAAERMTEVAELARLYPAARIVFTGGSGDLLPGTVTEAEAARALFTAFGIPADRMVFEDRSRTTWENATMTREILKPEPGRRWLLVTSAWHMPRAMGVFRQAGWGDGLVAFPTDYRTVSPWSWRADAASENFEVAEMLVKEVFGLVAYRLSGRSDALFPAP